ncbi:MAG: hypothetical protein NT099_03945 [Candidatus Saganbacteria bacterium]|nr:hypothetical protein [Candidatus Saganbacteria bacterium]
MKSFFLKICSFFIVFLLGMAVVAFAEDAYPRITFDGYKKYEYKNVNVTPYSNYFLGLSHLGGFVPNYTGGPWQERLLLKIEGQLNKQLKVTYDLEDQPETPSRYDVKVQYDNHEIIFGDVNIDITGNEFASVSKFLNGVIYRTKGGNYDFILVPSAKSKSQNQKITSFYGTGIRGPYSLGHTNIIDGSEQIYLNGILLARKKDYDIDYFEGRITLKEIINSGDEVKYTYEYTTIIDLFFPTLSKRDFFAMQGRTTFDPSQFGYVEPQPVPVVISAQDLFPSNMPDRATFESQTGTTAETVAYYKEQEKKKSIVEQESTGKYQLMHTPIVPFSEKVVLWGQVLKLEQDYRVNYDTGVLTLLTSDLPQDSSELKIEYQYKQTTLEVEQFQGVVAGKGPYVLSYNPVVLGSDKIKVNDALMKRDLDYTIDYGQGRILFNVDIGSATDIKVLYAHAVKQKPLSTKPAAAPTPLTVGGTYLKESGKRGGGAATATGYDTFKGSDIIGNSSSIFLSNFPITSSTEGTLIVKKNGVALTWGVDYVVPTTEVDPATGYSRTIPTTKLPSFINVREDLSNGYDTGAIKYLDTTLQATDEIIVAYTYKKPIVGRYSGKGNGSRGPYYISKNFRNIVGKTETIQVWTTGSSNITIYTRNGSIEPDMGATGYSFYYYQDNPYIMFNSELDSNKSFSTIFQYVPAAASTGSDIAQEVIGFDVKYSNQDLKFSGVMASSNADQVIISTATEEDFAGNGNRTYTLHSSSLLIENTEQVYVNNNLLNKDYDYYINYSTPGQLVFFYITPSTQDVISVFYEYQNSSGGGGGTRSQRGNAYKFEVSDRFFNSVDAGMSYKKLEPDFRPIGSTPLGSGSEYRNYKLAYNPQTNFSFGYDLLQTDDQIGTYLDKFLHRWDHRLSVGFVPYNLVKIGLTYRTFTSKDDLLPGAVLHTSDSVQEEWNGSIVPPTYQNGEVVLVNKNDFKTFYVKSDAIDLVDPRTDRTDFFHTNNTFAFTKRFSGDLDYQINEPKTITLTQEGGATVESVTGHTRSQDLGYGLNLDLTVDPLEKLALRAKFINHRADDLKNAILSNITRNESYHLDFVPIKPLVSSLDHNRIEDLAVIVGGRNPRTDRTSANVTYVPFSFTRLTWNLAQDGAILANGNVSGANSNTYTCDISPYTSPLWRIDANFKLFSKYAFAPQSTGEVLTNTDSFSQQYHLVFTPFTFLTLVPGLSQEDYFNHDNAVINQVYTKTQNQTATCKLTLLPMPSLTLTSDYLLLITKDFVGGSNKNKNVLANRLDYKFMGWGTLAYDWIYENNGGEVQGGILTDLNFTKNTHGLTVKINLPVDNPVFAGFVVDLGYKLVDYVDHKTSANNFQASLLSFEGAINF